MDLGLWKRGYGHAGFCVVSPWALEAGGGEVGAAQHPGLWRATAFPPARLRAARSACGVSRTPDGRQAVAERPLLRPGPAFCSPVGVTGHWRRLLTTSFPCPSESQ